MNTFLTALNTYWDGTSNLATNIGALYMEIQPADATPPYAVFSVISAQTTSKFGGALFSEPQIQFTVRAVGASTALTKCELLTTAFDEHGFSVGGRTFNMRLHDPIPEPSDPTQDEQGRDTFGWIVTYAYGIS